MKSNGKVRVVVQSRWVPSGLTEVQRPMGISSGFYFAPSVERKVIYQSVLDETQARAIEEARRLATDLGLKLEVVDTARSNVVRRALSKLASSRGTLPSLSIKKSWSTATADVCRDQAVSATRV